MSPSPPFGLALDDAKAINTARAPSPYDLQLSLTFYLVNYFFLPRVYRQGSSSAPLDIKCVIGSVV